MPCIRPYVTPCVRACVRACVDPCARAPVCAPARPSVHPSVRFGCTCVVLCSDKSMSVCVHVHALACTHAHACREHFTEHAWLNWSASALQACMFGCLCVPVSACTAPRHAMPRCATRLRTAPHRTAPHRTTPHHTATCHTLLCCTMPRQTTHRHPRSSTSSSSRGLKRK